MFSSQSFIKPIAAALLALAFLSPAASFAHEGEGEHSAMHHKFNAKDHAMFARKHLDKEASMLEIKASQQSAWDAYAAARLDLFASFAETKASPSAMDAAAIVRQHADRASAMATKLGNLADATASLQSVLDDNQKKVLDRIVRSHHGHHHHGWKHDEGKDGHGQGKHEGSQPASAKMAKPAAKTTAPAKPAN